MKHLINILWAWSHTELGDAIIGVILYAAAVVAFSTFIWLAA